MSNSHQNGRGQNQVVFTKNLKVGVDGVGPINTAPTVSTTNYGATGPSQQAISQSMKYQGQSINNGGQMSLVSHKGQTAYNIGT